MSLSVRVAQRLESLPESSAIALRIRADNYFDTIRGILDSVAPNQHLDSIYVTSTIPESSILNALEVLEIDRSEVETHHRAGDGKISYVNAHAF